jgi:DNA-binding MarR family transcriptional regulator
MWFLRRQPKSVLGSKTVTPDGSDLTRPPYKPILEELGLTYTHIAIVALGEQDNQTVSGLGEKLFLESTPLTPILKKLERMGYLRRQRDPADERQVLVSLTDSGANPPR